MELGRRIPSLGGRRGGLRRCTGPPEGYEQYRWSRWTVGNNGEEIAIKSYVKRNWDDMICVGHVPSVFAWALTQMRSVFLINSHSLYIITIRGRGSVRHGASALGSGAGGQLAPGPHARRGCECRLRLLWMVGPRLGLGRVWVCECVCACGWLNILVVVVVEYDNVVFHVFLRLQGTRIDRSGNASGGGDCRSDSLG